jgi:hypothetical protein
MSNEERRFIRKCYESSVRTSGGGHFVSWVMKDFPTRCRVHLLRYIATFDLDLTPV